MWCIPFSQARFWRQAREYMCTGEPSNGDVIIISDAEEDTVKI
jgi:hypothetical protein